MTDSTQRRTDEEAITYALFRYGVIAEAVEAQRVAADGDAADSVTDAVRQAAARRHYLPGRGPITVTERTLWSWLARYRDLGIEGLTPKRRKDRGTRRALSDELLRRAIKLRTEQPGRTTKTLIDILRLEGRLDGVPSFHRSTLDRHLDRAGASRRRAKHLGARRTIKQKRDRFGDLWVGDYHHGPLVLAPDGRVVTAKIGAFLDHCTRYPVADRYYLSEQLATLRDTMLRAFLRWGAPRVVYVDRGSVYRSQELAWSLQKVGCRLVHSRAYYSQGRGLIEKWWQPVKQFEDEVRARDELLTIHQLNSLWEAYRQQRYCEDVHTELGCTPQQAVADVVPDPIDPEVARLLFRCRETRSVHKKDACVRVLARPFLCESFLRGRKVHVLYDPRDLSSVDIELDGQRVQTAFPQPINAPAEPHAEEAPERLPQSVDYLALLRADYDKKLLEHARPLAYADLALQPGFSEDDFVSVVTDLAGVAATGAAQRELKTFWKTFGPLPEDLVRIGVEHAVRLHGRGRHAAVYIHAVRTLVLAHWRGGSNKETP